MTILPMSAVLAAITFPAYFTSHMVLQHDEPIPVWGTAEPGEKVEVSFGDFRGEDAADEKGRWRVDLPAMKPSHEGRTLTIGNVKLEDVLVGDVWLCAGQSNMEFVMGMRPIGYEEFVKEAAENPSIRRFKVGHLEREYPNIDSLCAAPGGRHAPQWLTTKDVFQFTAVGYFFARRINQETKLPIGLVDVSWSASSIEPFMSASSFRGVPGLESYVERIDATYPNTERGAAELAKYRADLAEWEKAGGLAPRPHLTSLSEQHLTTRYNGMIHPLTRFPVKGVIWYQGCANAADGEDYLPLFKAMVEGWRKAWKKPELPFYSVQLAAFWDCWRRAYYPEGGEGFTLVREAQRKSIAAVPHSGVAVTIDLGEPYEIHPHEKLHVGERLARWALRNEYGQKDLVVSGPLYAGFKKDGGRIRISFEKDSLGSGLMVGYKSNADNLDPVAAKEGTELEGFSIAGEDRIWQWAKAKIENGEVVVWSDMVKAPVAVRYAFCGAPECNLYNREGLPASPFRTDDWPCQYKVNR